MINNWVKFNESISREQSYKDLLSISEEDGRNLIGELIDTYYYLLDNCISYYSVESHKYIQYLVDCGEGSKVIDIPDETGLLSREEQREYLSDEFIEFLKKQKEIGESASIIKYMRYWKYAQYVTKLPRHPNMVSIYDIIMEEFVEMSDLLIDVDRVVGAYDVKPYLMDWGIVSPNPTYLVWVEVYYEKDVDDVIGYFKENSDLIEPYGYKMDFVKVNPVSLGRSPYYILLHILEN